MDRSRLDSIRKLQEAARSAGIEPERLNASDYRSLRHGRRGLPPTSELRARFGNWQRLREMLIAFEDRHHVLRH
jgi:hypothetical protein